MTYLKDPVIGAMIAVGCATIMFVVLVLEGLSNHLVLIALMIGIASGLVTRLIPMRVSLLLLALSLVFMQFYFANENASMFLAACALIFITAVMVFTERVRQSIHEGAKIKDYIPESGIFGLFLWAIQFMVGVVIGFTDQSQLSLTQLLLLSGIINLGSIAAAIFLFLGFTWRKIIFTILTGILLIQMANFAVEIRIANEAIIVAILTSGVWTPLYLLNIVIIYGLTRAMHRINRFLKK